MTGFGDISLTHFVRERQRFAMSAGIKLQSNCPIPVRLGLSVIRLYYILRFQRCLCFPAASRDVRSGRHDHTWQRVALFLSALHIVRLLADVIDLLLASDVPVAKRFNYVFNPTERHSGRISLKYHNGFMDPGKAKFDHLFKSFIRDRLKRWRHLPWSH